MEKTAEQIFESALSKVESSSIRSWASSERNRPIFLEIVQNGLKKNPKLSEDTVTGFIVSKAIGLID